MKKLWSILAVFLVVSLLTTAVFANPLAASGTVASASKTIGLLDASESGEPQTPEDPSEPQTPEDPSEPQTPGDPSEPEAPEDPSEPEAPEDPSEPEAPEDPSEPQTPEDPSEPEAPEDPSEPEAPEDPSEPEIPEEPEVREDESHIAYVSGYADGSFGPKKSMTRGELAAVLYRLGDYPEGPTAFSDVPKRKWYAAAVNALAAAGIVSGYSDGTFRPKNPVTRAELVTLLCNVADLHTAQMDERFPDVSKKHWAYKSIMVAREQGWTSGYPDGTFRPSNPVTRAEAVTMINQCLNRVADIAAIDGGEAARFFPDVQPGDWFYYQVMEAAVGHTAHYETPEASELWLSPEVPSALLADGFYCINGKLYAAVNGDYLHEAGSGTLNGVRYTCAGASGVCTVQGELLTLATGELIFLNNGKPVYAPGRYPNGFHYRYGKLYAAVNGNLVNWYSTGTLNGVRYTCAGASGVCTAQGELLTLVSGELVLLNNGKLLYAPGQCPSGFYVRSGKIYAAVNGNLVNKQTTGTLNGVSYTCAGTSGVCTVQGDVLTLVSGELVLLNNGKLLYAPGQCPNGFHYRNGKLYVAVNGNLVNKQTTGTLNGVSYTCAGASGVCTAKTEILTAADGNRWHLKNNVISTTAGLYEISGAMYYAQSSGMMLRNGDYHTLHFGNDCRYTSGNSTIDSYIDKIVASQTNSSMTRERKLFALYCYVAYNSNRYISNNNHVPRGQDGSQWLEPYMLRLIQMGGGNCYCYAAQFYYLARRVGYWQAKGVSGGTSPNNMDHGWVEMELNGTLYLFDPRLDGSYYIRQQHEAPGRLYMKTYDNLPWRYWRP